LYNFKSVYLYIMKISFQYMQLYGKNTYIFFKCMYNYHLDYVFIWKSFLVLIYLDDFSFLLFLFFPCGFFSDN
jgi:hypothetical protein